MERKPIIGITCNYEENDRIGLVTDLGTKGQDWNYIAGDYIYMTENAGAVPLLIPTSGNQDTYAVLSVIDGLILSGGSDVGPHLYGEFPGKELGTVNPLRDYMEVELARKAMEKDIPIYGICRGIQILNVALGGTLYQDLPENGFNAHSLGNKYPRNTGWHEVRLLEGSLLRDIIKKDSMMVNSFHHQAVKAPGTGVKVTAVSEDSVTEAVEVSGKRFVLAVQWHPEMMYDSEQQLSIMERFVEACAEKPE